MEHIAIKVPQCTNKEELKRLIANAIDLQFITDYFEPTAKIVISNEFESPEPPPPPAKRPTKKKPVKKPVKKAPPKKKPVKKRK
jgi:hypothetical protein